MTQSTLTTSSVFGHCGEEIQCLLRQSRLYNPCTQRLLEQAGITTGMKVLAVGSGAGDVTLLAGELVGKRGMVVGVEHDLALLEIVRARARSAGLTQVSFVAGDLRNVALARDFDAVIGRNILLYLTDPVALLRVGVQHLRPGGIVVFHEFDFSVIERLLAAEDAPAFSGQVVRWLSAGFCRVGAPVRLGTQLSEAFVEAGLPFPQVRLGSLVGSGPDWADYDLLAETLCIILDRQVAYGIVQAGEVDIDTWSERLRAEGRSPRLFIASSILVGAWARVGKARE
jgi:SAM-dependent methyltransferase